MYALSRGHFLLRFQVLGSRFWVIGLGVLIVKNLNLYNHKP